MNPQPAIVSHGLICLDAIQANPGEYALAAGGTGLNPPLVLHQWGWRIFPIGLIGDDAAASHILADLARWDFCRDFILRSSAVQTPVYIETVYPGRHEFLRECPQCGQPFPPFTPLSLERMESLFSGLPGQIDVCLIERVTPSALALARECKLRGALLYVEPNRIADPSVWPELLEAADILKYSREKLPMLFHETDAPPIPLEILTQGREGLLFRIASNGVRSDWIRIPAEPCDAFIDAAGSGDWLTASILHHLAQGNFSLMSHLQERKVADILRHGQMISSKNCEHIGPRGSMYQTTPMRRGDDFCANCSSK